GMIDQGLVQRAFAGFAVASGANVHLLLQSTGGNIGDAIALYNYLHTLQIELHVYNGGSFASAGVLVFLGAKHRYASTYATFMIHKSSLNPAVLGAMAQPSQ